MLVARPAGFEPATLGSEDRCSNPLSYGRIQAPFYRRLAALCSVCVAHTLDNQRTALEGTGAKVSRASVNHGIIKRRGEWLPSDVTGLWPRYMDKEIN